MASAEQKTMMASAEQKTTMASAEQKTTMASAEQKTKVAAGKMASAEQKIKMVSAEQEAETKKISVDKEDVNDVKDVQDVQDDSDKFVDETGEVVDDDEKTPNDGGRKTEEMKRYFANKHLQRIATVLAFIKCIPYDPEDLLTRKCWIYWLQWLALVCDLIGAVIAVISFNDVTECCGIPILDIAGTFPWREVIRYATYLYFILIVVEPYPVLHLGIPCNLVNPLVGFVVAFAMFFDDSKTQALAMWGIESAAIAVEIILFQVKSHHNEENAEELKRITEIRKQPLRPANKGENPRAPQKERRQLRQRYYYLKKLQLQEAVHMWYLKLGCFLNVFLSLIMLVLIIVISQGGGLCINNFSIPNPFNLDQHGQCSLCFNVTGTGESESCELCYGDMKQCYYSYA